MCKIGSKRYVLGRIFVTLSQILKNYVVYMVESLRSQFVTSNFE